MLGLDFLAMATPYSGSLRETWVCYCSTCFKHLNPELVGNYNLWNFSSCYPFSGWTCTFILWNRKYYKGPLRAMIKSWRTAWMDLHAVG
jgi:hypothetical protein